MARRRRKEIKYVEDPKERSITRCKRRNGLCKKAEEFHKLTGDRVVLVTINPKGKLHYVCEPSIPEMTSTDRRLQGDVMQMDDCDSWGVKCLAFLRCLQEKSKDLENPAAKIGAGDDSGVGAGVGNDFKILNGDEINEERVDHVISSISPADLSATGGEGLGMVSNPLCSDIKDIDLLFACLNECLKDPFIQSVLEKPAPSDREWMDLKNKPSNAGAGGDSGIGAGLDPECLNDDSGAGNGVNCHNLSTPPVDSAAGSESSRTDFHEFCNNCLEDITSLPNVNGPSTLL